MASKRYQVFLSSTYEDLRDERFAVMEAIHSLKCFVAGMEYFPAIDKNQYEYIKKIIDECDYYLLILGGRYGSIPDGEEKSYTEKEYEYAVSQNKPVIALLRSDIDKLPQDKCEQNAKLKHRYKEFRRTLKTGRLVKEWRDTSELKAQAVAAVVAAIDAFPDVPGWIRGNSAAGEEILQEIHTLRKENLELKKSIQTREIKCLEFLKRAVPVLYHINDRGNNIDVLMIKIFIALAGKFISQQSRAITEITSCIKEQIISIIQEDITIDEKLISVNPDDIMKILALFTFLDLIQAIDGSDGYFKLTEFGKRVFFEIMLVAS